MAQESRLAVTIDSRGAKRNADDLTDSLKGMERAGEGATSSTEGLSSSIDEQRKELSQLLGQINPTVSALGRLDDMQEKLAKFKKAGIVESDTFVEYSDRINVMRNALGETADGMNATGMSAKQMQNNLRMLPAQFTDIAVSLQSGQAPLTVLLQQGGQLKDMFGGIGPAARAMGGYIAGLVNPFTLAAAVAGALAVAYYQGSEESERFANALIENGNAAGTSANQLADLANQVASTGTTVGAAAGVLTQLAAAGNPLTSMYAEITQASLAWSKQTGRDVTEVVKSFNDIAKNPVEAIKKLDGELNILTASQYANIVSLQEQGKTMDAARMAAALYLEEINGRSAKIKENLGDIENLWNGIAGAAAKAWDSMLAVGRDQTLEDQIANTEKILAGRKQGFLSSLFSEDDASTKFLENKLTQLQNALAANTAKAAADANSKAIQDAGKKASDTINATYKAGQSQTEKLQSQLKDLDKARAASLAAGSFSAEQEVKYAGARKSIEQQIADIKEREAKKNKPKAAKENNRGVSEAENTFAKLYNQYDPAAQAARALTKEQGQLQLVLDKGKISQEEYGKALAQSSINYAAAIKGAQGLTQAEQYRAQLEKQLSTQRTQYSLEAAGVGMGDLQSARLQQRVQLEQQTNDRVLQLRTELANATTEKQRQDLQAQIDLTNEYLPRQLEALTAGQAQMDQAMLSPLNGWTAALQNFQASATDIAGQTQSMFTGAFNTMSAGVGSAFAKMAFDGQSFGTTMASVTRTMAMGVVSALGEMGAKWLATQAIQLLFGETSTLLHAKEMAMVAAETTAKTTGAAAVATAKVAADGVVTASSLASTATTTTAQVAAAGTTLSAWLPAALVASVGSFGAAAIVGGTALLAAFALIKGFKTGGYTGNGGTSDVAGVVHGKEFVVNAEGTKRNRALLEAINSGERVSVSGQSISVNKVSGSGEQVQGAQQTNVYVNLVEDQSRAGTVRQSTRDDGSTQIDAFVADIWGGGERAQAIEQAYGLTRQGT
jgi:lambda family phage tail tape measure protein